MKRREKPQKTKETPERAQETQKKEMKDRVVYEQRRVDLATFRALPASTWGHCSQVLCFTIVWDTPAKEKVAKWSPAPASILEGFNESYVVYRPKKPCKTREKRQSCQIDPCLPPYVFLFSGDFPDWSVSSLRGRKSTGKELSRKGP